MTFLHFWLIFVEVPSENVVAMATREDLFPSFDFKTSPIYIFRKSHKVSRKNILSFRSYAPKTSRGVGVG